jgi:hypothetical protein
LLWQELPEFRSDKVSGLLYLVKEMPFPPSSRIGPRRAPHERTGKVRKMTKPVPIKWRFQGPNLWNRRKMLFSMEKLRGFLK